MKKYFIIFVLLLMMLILAFGCNTPEKKLNTPIGLNISFGILSWDKVTDASGYQICIDNDYDNYVTVNSYNLFISTTKKYEIKVKALSDGTIINSEWSDIYVYDYKSEIDANAEFKVSFNTMGGSEISSQQVKANNLVTKPLDPTKTGFTFDNWYKDISYQYLFDFSTKITSDSTLYAKWSAEKGTQITISFITNGGNPIDSVTHISGDPYTPPTPSGYDGIFIGWYYDANLTNAFTDNTVINNSLTLYAKWNDEDSEDNNNNNNNNNNLNNPVNVYLYESRYSYTAWQSSVIEKGSVFSLPSSNPVKENCVFLAWYEYYSDKEYDFNLPVDGTLSLYAVFIPLSSGSLIADSDNVSTTLTANSEITYSFTPLKNSVFQFNTSDVYLNVNVYNGTKLYIYGSNFVECYMESNENYNIVIKNTADQSKSFSLSTKSLYTVEMNLNTKITNVAEDKNSLLSNTYFIFTPSDDGLYSANALSLDNQSSGDIYISDITNQRTSISEFSERSESSVSIVTFKLKKDKKYLVKFNTYYIYSGDITFDIIIQKRECVEAAASNNSVNIADTYSKIWYSYTPINDGVYNIKVTSEDFKVLVYALNSETVYIDDYDSYYDSVLSFNFAVPMKKDNVYYLVFMSSSSDNFGDCTFDINMISEDFANGASITVNDENKSIGVFFKYSPTETGYKTFSTSNASSIASIEIFDIYNGNSSYNTGTTSNLNASLQKNLIANQIYFIQIYFKDENNNKINGTAIININ